MGTRSNDAAEFEPAAHTSRRASGAKRRLGDTEHSRVVPSDDPLRRRNRDSAGLRHVDRPGRIHDSVVAVVDISHNRLIGT